MKNSKIYLVCPFSFMENYIRREFGEESYFITSMASVMLTKDDNFYQYLRGLIVENNIPELVVNVDLECDFFNRVFFGEKLYETPSEMFLKAVFDSNRSEIVSESSILEQKIRFAEIVINSQIDNLNALLNNGSDDLPLHFKITGLITNKSENFNVRIHDNELLESYEY